MKLLLVVDMQKDFVDGTLGFAGSEKIIAPICAKIQAYQRENADIYFTRDLHGADYAHTQEGRNLPIEHCIAGSSGCEIVPELRPYVTAANTLDKLNAFGTLRLAELLKTKNYRQIEICGLVTNICVMFAAVIAKTALPEALIIIDENCVSSYDRSLHEQTLAVLAGAQVQIIRS